MSSNSSLLYVPIEVKALVVNDETRYSQPFQRWQMSYNNLSSFVSPTPPPFNSIAAGWNNDPTANGVYLHWSLPDSLRHGQQTGPGSPMQFPLVPNRWLVLRYNGPVGARTVAAWVVESDFIDPNNGTSPYLQPGSSSPQPTFIGRHIPLGTWSETGTQPLFLTAVGPGDISFASFQSNVEDVFSIHDPLTGIPPTDTLAYLVAGWYSDPTKDILTVNNAAFANVMTALNWITDNASLSANTTILHSMVHGIQWSQQGPPPVSVKPTNPANVTMAVGNTSIDALTALITQQANASGQSGTVNPALLEAFQYNLLPQLNQPNGAQLVDQAIHKAWFGSSGGGYEWVITQASQSGTTPSQSSPSNDPNLNPSWLQNLNQDQLAYDQAVEQLNVLQWRLYSSWWTGNKFSQLPFNKQKLYTNLDPNFTAGNFQAQIDPTQAGSLAAQVQQQQQLATALLAKIPWGDTQDALMASAQAYGTAKNMLPNYVLKRTTRQTYYEANNPVVLIAGAKTSGTLTTDQKLSCRFASELVTGFTYNGTAITAAQLQGTIPSPGFSNLPYDLTPLLNEFFLLDPDNATSIAAKALGKTDAPSIQALNTAMSAYNTLTGNVPALDLTSWVQPWQPLYIMWEVNYYPIAHDVNGAENWSFDGKQYSWNGNGAATQPITLQGRIFLTPQAGFNFKSRIDEYISKHPDLDNTALKNLENLITQTDNWDFLSQSLDGFMQQLALRDVQSNVLPGDPVLCGLIGDQDSVLPILGNGPVPFEGWQSSFFQQYRSGQFAFNWVDIVDRFGQTVEVVTPNTQLQYTPVTAPDLLPVNTVMPQEPYRFVEMKPRLLQPAKLNFDFVSSSDDSKIIQPGSSDNPVCAWLLTNHIDRALSCYDNTGQAIGELGLVTSASGTPVVNWQGAPSGNYSTPAQVAAAFPHLGEVLNGLMTAGVTAFQNFYDSIDATMWTIDPLGNRDDQNLSVLIGRPLALVRCSLQYEVQGMPVWDPSWQYVFNPQLPAFTGYNFPVRLGELALRNDGLMGYFAGNNYSVFNCMYMPANMTPANPPYLDLIAPGNFINLQFNTQQQFVTMLIDPRASVHATTSILPVVSVSIPTRFVDPVMKALAVTFNTGPLLGGLAATADGNTISIIMPPPAEKNGTWTWLTPSGDSYTLAESDAKANFPGDAPVLRSGTLQLGQLKQP